MKNKYRLYRLASRKGRYTSLGVKTLSRQKGRYLSVSPKSLGRQKGAYQSLEILRPKGRIIFSNNLPTDLPGEDIVEQYDVTLLFDPGSIGGALAIGTGASLGASFLYDRFFRRGDAERRCGAKIAFSGRLCGKILRLYMCRTAEGDREVWRCSMGHEFDNN